MRRTNRSPLAADARQRNVGQLARLGADLRASRRRRHLRLVDASGRTGLSPSAISAIERGRGGSFSVNSLQLVALAVGRQLDFRLTADTQAEPADAGHLAIQELVLRLGRRAGRARTFELPTRPADPLRSADVGLRDEQRRLLLLVECWNTIGDVGAAARASERKRAEAEQMAVAIAPLDDAGLAVPHRVRSCWVVRASARNRALVARYPEVFAARFPGSSAGWLRALTTAGVEPPEQPGIVWCDVGATRLFAWRRRG
jgi:transcriptional regulator with XRE-family HTH domain